MFNSLRWFCLLSFTLLNGLLSLNLPVTAQTNDLENALTVRSDIQEANSDTGVITARGNVKIYYPARQMQATAAQAQYFSKERRLVLTGNVYVLQNGNSMRAETMTYLIDQGHFIATPKSDQQVESIYIVSDPESEKVILSLSKILIR
jgi:lipopolysaccharide export system protein LptA